MNKKLDVRVVYYISIGLYFIYYCFLNYFQNEFDFLHLYEIVLKVKENKILYTDYNIWYGPHLILFLTILKKFFILNFVTIFFLGFFQNVLLAFIVLKIFEFFIKDKDYLPHVFFVSLIWINPSIHQFWWDYYAFFFGLLAIYFYLSNKFILSAFIFSTIFFLKQTQGIWFLSIFACLLFRDYLLKTINFKILLYFVLGVIINLFIIFLFYDLNTYYNNSVKFITQYTDSLYEVNYSFYKKFILQFFKIQIDQHIVFSSSFWKSKGIITFYFLFVLPFHILMIYYFINIKNYKTNFFLFIFIILLTSAVLPPLIGRGYFSKVFIIYLSVYILIFIFSKNMAYKKYTLIFSSIIFGIYGFVYNVKQINFDENLIIREPKNPFLNINYNFYKDKQMFYDSKIVHDLIIKKKLNNIFVTGNYSRIPVLLSNQISQNYNLYFYPIWQPPIPNFKNTLGLDFGKKKPTYLISAKFEYEKFIIGNELFLDLLLNYELYFENQNFLIYKKK